MKSRFLMLFIVTIFLFSGCVSQTPPPRPDQQVKVPEGQKLVGFYFDALVKGDPTAAQQYVSGNAKKVNLISSKLRVLGYSISQGKQEGTGAKYLVKLYQTANIGDTAYFETKDVDITVSKDYVIADIIAKQESTVKDNDGKLIYKDNKTEKKLLDISSLPSTVRPQSGSGTFGIDRNAFAEVALSPDKKYLLVATNGTHGFLGKYKLGDGKLSSVDLYVETSVNRVTWSADSKYYALEITKPNGLADIILYTNETDKSTKLPMNNLFSDPENIRSRPFFAGNNFIFSVENKKNKKATNWYFYNLESKNTGRSFR